LPYAFVAAVRLFCPASRRSHLYRYQATGHCQAREARQIPHQYATPRKPAGPRAPKTHTKKLPVGCGRLKYQSSSAALSLEQRSAIGDGEIVSPCRHHGDLVGIPSTHDIRQRFSDRGIDEQLGVVDQDYSASTRCDRQRMCVCIDVADENTRQVGEVRELGSRRSDHKNLDVRRFQLLAENSQRRRPTGAWWPGNEEGSGAGEQVKPYRFGAVAANA
jgi:hypothetical protein